MQYVAVFIASFMFFNWLAAPSQADISRCIDSSIYTADQCLHEMTK